MSKIAILFLIILTALAVVIAGGVYFLIQAPKTYDTFEIQGMKVEILHAGQGETAKTGDMVTVHYIGTLQDGTKFDSSFDKNEPFQFKLGENLVIKGWELGIVGMKVGEKRRLTIPPELGYGPYAVGNLIPPNSTLIFEIDLLGVN